MRVIIFVFLLLFVFAPFAEAANNLPSTSVEAHTHYCPMHQEVIGAKGDTCPVCGMNLVLREAGEAAGAMPEHDHESHEHEVMFPVTDDGKLVYICPMHPHITGEEGDRCPICGMNLMPKEKEPPAEASDEQSLLIDPGLIQVLGVRTAEVSHRNLGRDIRAFGSVLPSTRREHMVAVRADGWIVDLAASAVGDRVEQGDLLFTYYSPDLMAAQSDYLIGSRIGNAEQRLRQYGMGDQAIALLRDKGEMLDETPFYAPVSGTVTTLNTRQGDHIEEGGMVLILSNLEEVWINANVPVRGLQFLKTGDPAIIRIPHTGKKVAASVDFIHPVIDPESRTGMVRLVADNKHGNLKPQTYVDITFRTAIESRLAVPAEAVLYGTGGAYVFEDLGEGRFRPVMVETGITSDGFTEIRSGLAQGQRIVTSGQFMLDAESNLRGGMVMSLPEAEEQEPSGHVR